MPALPRHRAKLHTTTLILVAWMFALAAGIANACVLHDRHAGHAGHDGRVEASASAPAHSEESTSACKAAWDASASTAVKPAGQDSSSPHTAFAAAQSRPAYPNLAPAAVLEPALADGEPARGPPAAIRFLRLRL